MSRRTIIVITSVLRRTRFEAASVVALVLLMVGSASQAAPATPAGSSAASEESRTALACTSSSNCVNTLGSSALGPLRFEGTATQAIAALRATLAKFPQAKIIKSDGLTMEVVFTTTLGFRDLVDFRVDAEAQRIDYRSRSLVGRYDFGKNRSRMSAFSTQFEQTAMRAPVNSR